MEAGKVPSRQFQFCHPDKINVESWHFRFVNVPTFPLSIPSACLPPPPPPPHSLILCNRLSLRHTVASCSDTFCVSVFSPPPYMSLSSGHTDASCSDTFCLSVPPTLSVGHTNASCSDIFHLSPPASLSLSLIVSIYPTFSMFTDSSCSGTVSLSIVPILSQSHSVSVCLSVCLSLFGHTHTRASCASVLPFSVATEWSWRIQKLLTSFWNWYLGKKQKTTQQENNNNKKQNKEAP